MPQAVLKCDPGFIPMSNAGSALAAGDVVVTGNRIGIVSGSKPIAAGEDYTLQTVGIFNMSALSTDTWSPGALLYWDDTNNRLTTTASTHKSAGLATGTKTNGQTTADCDINASVASGTI